MEQTPMSLTFTHFTLTTAPPGGDMFMFSGPSKDPDNADR